MNSKIMIRRVLILALQEMGEVNQVSLIAIEIIRQSKQQIVAH
jgi:hypothetical protein